MSAKILPVIAIGLLLGSAALASAQTIASPHYWGGGGYDGPGTADAPASQPKTHLKKTAQKIHVGQGRRHQ